MRCKMNDMMGPAVLVTVGTMWLLNNILHHERGLTFIAVVLIVIGGVKMLQSSASTEGHRQPFPYQASYQAPYQQAGDATPATAPPQTDDRQVNNNG